MAGGRERDIEVVHVDDEREFAELTATYLERSSDRIAVRTETDPEEALAAVREGSPDCVVSDHDMPGMTGLDLLRAVREDDPALPFVLFTGKGSEEIASEAISAGVTDYLQKGGGGEKYDLLANRIENAVASHRLEAAFEAEHAKLTSLFENSPDAIVELTVVDGEAVVDAVNRAFEETFGVDEADAAGKPLEDLIVPADRLDEAHELNERARRGEPFRTEVRRLAADGRRDFLLTAVPVPETSGYAVYTDVTEARQRERRLETLMENVPGVIYRCRNEPGWPMEFVGGDCEALTGYTAASLEAGEVVWGEDVLHPRDEDHAWEVVQEAVDDDEPFEVTYRIRTRDGEVRWCWERGRGVFEDGGLVALEGYIVDVTDARSMASALRACEATLASVAEDGALHADEDGRRDVAATLERVREVLGDVDGDQYRLGVDENGSLDGGDGFEG